MSKFTNGQEASWNVRYQVLRVGRLEPRECAAITELICEVNAEPWDADEVSIIVADEPMGMVVASGIARLSMNGTSDDGPRLCDLLTRLQQLLPTAEVHVSDELGLLGWSSHSRRFEFGGTERRDLRPIAP